MYASWQISNFVSTRLSDFRICFWHEESKPQVDQSIKGQSKMATVRWQYKLNSFVQFSSFYQTERYVTFVSTIKVNNVSVGVSSCTSGGGGVMFFERCSPLLILSLFHVPSENFWICPSSWRNCRQHQQKILSNNFGNILSPGKRKYGGHCCPVPLQQLISVQF